MTASARRLWLYGLLLFLPALAVGGLALGLLAREQARLAEREAAAVEARRAAVGARARLIAENIELLVADVQTTLMGTLQAAPPDEPRAFLAEWQVANPLVREVFRATADGRSVWGAESAPVRDWLAAAPWRETASPGPAREDRDALPALVRHRRAFAEEKAEIAAAAKNAAVAPAPAAAAPAAPVVAEEAAETKAVAQRRSVENNVLQYQSARQEIQKVASQAPVVAANNSYNSNASGNASKSAPSSSSFRLRSSYVAEPPPQAGASFEAPDSGKLDFARTEGEAAVFLDAPAESTPRIQGFVVADAAPASDRLIGEMSVAGVPAASGSTAWGDDRAAAFSAAEPVAVMSPSPAAAPVRAAALPLAESLSFGVASPGRAGWTPWRDAAGRLHLFGWRELPDGTFIGIELALDAIKSRFREVFPAAVEAGQGFVLRDATGAVWHAVAASAAPLVDALPLSADFLPGWKIEARDAGIYPLSSASGGGVFATGAAIVALLVLAIVAAGALLLRQARRSEVEAALKTSFVANVSHELKTPLTTIRLYAELLAQGRVREEQKRADYLAVIGQETQRLARLVGNVLDFSRLEQGKKKYDLAAFDLAAELRGLAAAHGPRLAAAGLELGSDLPERAELVSDRDAVAQIVLNLLDNACKYAAEGGEAALSLRLAGPGAEIVVADRGPGVPEAQRERIFEKFHRVDDRLTAEKGGAGLGLSIARQLARGLGGDLVHRPRAGGGSEFVLSLPVSRP